MPEEVVNPFAAAMSQAKAAGEEFTKMFSGMKLPSMPDMSALMQAHQKNIEALSSANRVALEGAQTVAKRHMEIMQQTMAELTDAMRGLASAGAGEKAARQTELIKHAYERAVANAKELADLIQHSNAEALGLLNQRITEAMDEAKALLGKAGEKI